MWWVLPVVTTVLGIGWATWVRRAPRTAGDEETVEAYARFRSALARSGRVEKVIAVDALAGLPSAHPAPSVAADEEALPFRDGALDLVVSALALQFVNDLPGTLTQIRRALRWRHGGDGRRRLSPKRRRDHGPRALFGASVTLSRWFSYAFRCV